MEEKERYFVKKISNDCLFPETLCVIKDKKSKLYIVLEDKDTAIIIKDLLNQQDKRIKELETELENYKLCKCVNCSNEYEYGLETSIAELEQENQQLKSQIEQMAKDYTSEIAFWTGANDKQLAIEKLKQIINYMENSNNNRYPLPYEIKNFIENQIKELNGEE